MSTTLKRFLATVLFVDMVGYSKLMDEHEAAAIRTRQRMEDIIRVVVPAHQGEIIQFYGDGALILFPNTLDAVLCAGSMQKQLRSEPAIPVRIGIHTGEVSRDRYNVYGDPVNIASRVESFAVPGSVLFSDKVYDDLHNHPTLKVSPLGTFQLKNIREPVRLYALSDDHLVVPVASEMKGKGEEKKRSIAVLPFVNMSADPENEYFSDGIAEELLNALAKVSALKVTARTSSFAYKGRNLNVRQIGEELRVETVLEGSVRKAGNRVRITVQLIDTADGYHLLSETYDRDLDDIFAVQDDIAQAISTALQSILGIRKPEKKALVKKTTDNLQAYQFYLKGIFYWNTYNPKDVEKAVDCMEQAVRLDPSFSQAWASISVSYSYLGAMDQLPGEIAFQKAWEASEKALELDDQSEKTHSARGLVHMFRNWDFISAEKSFMRAKSLSSEDTFFAKSYSTFLIIRGRFQEAVNLLEDALVVDPLSLVLNTALADAYIQTGEYRAARHLIDQMLEMFPNMYYIQLLKGTSYLFEGDYEKGLSVLKVKVDPADPLYSEFIAWRAYAFFKMEKKERVNSCLLRLEELYQNTSSAPVLIDTAYVQYLLGHAEQAFDLLDRALDDHLSGLLFLLFNRRWSSLRADTRFQEFRKKMGIRD